MERPDPVFDPPQQVLVHPPFHIADGDIRMGAFAGLEDFHGKGRVPDPPADQSSIKDQSFHKAVPGTPQDLVLIRFRNASGRVGAAVDGNALEISVDEKAGEAGKQLDGDRRFVGFQTGFPVGDIFFGKIMGVGRHIRVFYRREGLHQL